MLYFQGNFTSWLDGSPLGNIGWNNKELRNQWPQNISLYNAEVLPSDNEMLGAIQFIFHLSNIFPQPEFDIERNCTAVFTSFSCKPTGWVAIPCQQKIFTNFVCEKQRNKPITSSMNNTRPKPLIKPKELNCEREWFLIGQKCLYLMTFDKNVSFDEAQFECASYESKILSVEQVLPPYPYKYNFNLNSELASIGINFPEKYASLQNKLVTSIPFPIKVNYYLDAILDIVLLVTPNDIMFPIIEDSTNDCWVVVQGNAIPADIYTPVGVVEQHYDIKKRFCSVPIKVFSFICEKQPIALNITCGPYQSGCWDGSCILLIYVCDGVYDCLDKEDEVECPPMTYKTDGIVTINNNNTLMIPCIKSDTNNTVNKQTVEYVHVHSLCDGKHVCYVISEDLCTYNSMKYISLSRYGVLKHLAHHIHFSGNYLEKLIEDIKHNKLLEKGYVNKSETQYLKYDVTNLQLLCNENNVYYNFTDFCYIRDRHLCTYAKYSVSCVNLLCPGMFKCFESFCIRLSYVCDGHIDCPGGQDEINCSNISCNGFLKCRNENRCVGLQQICDGVVDCHYSSDDELFCGECPTYCICTGYTTHCTAIHENTYRLITASYAKAVVFKTIIKHAIIQNMLTKGLVYIDLSVCELQSISSKQFNKIKHFSNILYANFSNNLIEVGALLTQTIFSKLVILDLSINFFTILGNNTFKSLSNLKTLLLDQNPIIHFKLSVFRFNKKFTILGLQRVDFRRQIIVERMSTYLNFTIVVDDTSFCCYFQERVDCVVKTRIMSNFICSGLIHEHIKLVIFKCLTTLAILTSAVFTGYYVYYVGRQAKHNFLFLTFINIGVSELLLSVCLICLAIANNINVNVIIWQTSVYCIVLHSIVTISLAANIIVKVLSSYVLLLKICYPFKHQCRYVRFMWLLCLLVWIALAISYTLFVSHADMHFLYSAFCTVWCQNSDFIYLNIVIASLEFISICLLIVCVKLMATRLNQSSAVFTTAARSNMTLKVCLPFVLETIGDISLRFPITTIVILNIFEARQLDTWCENVILYLVPCKIVICSISHILLKVGTLYKK